MRIPVIAGNWKMHKTSDETQDFVYKLISILEGVENCGEVEIIIAPAFTSLEIAIETARESRVKIAAQNMHWESKGAYTGEISPVMLRDIGVSHCIIGHSERRQYFAETDDTVNKKVRAALGYGIIPIVCVGETLEEREKGATSDVVERQIKIALAGLNSTEVEGLIIAYEPVWAIGTGKTSSSEDAQAVAAKIREVIANDFGSASANKVRIQYGGSVKPENIKSFMEQNDIDGALVGGASLDVDSFVKLITY